MLLLTECVWEFKNNASWDTHLHALFYSTIIDIVQAYVQRISTILHALSSDNHHFTSFYICAVKMEKVLSQSILPYQVCQIYSYFVYVPYFLPHTFMQHAYMCLTLVWFLLVLLQRQSELEEDNTEQKQNTEGFLHVYGFINELICSR